MILKFGTIFAQTIEKKKCGRKYNYELVVKRHAGCLESSKASNGAFQLTLKSIKILGSGSPT